MRRLNLSYDVTVENDLKDGRAGCLKYERSVVLANSVKEFQRDTKRGRTRGHRTKKTKRSLGTDYWFAIIFFSGKILLTDSREFSLKDCHLLAHYLKYHFYYKVTDFQDLRCSCASCYNWTEFEPIVGRTEGPFFTLTNHTINMQYNTTTTW